MTGPSARELTPRGSGGVSVIEIVGPGAREAASRIANTELAVGALRLVRLEVHGPERDELLDEALAWCESDERVELHVHGSPPLVRRVLELFPGRSGLDRPRTLEERALELLGGAACDAGARILLDQAEGALRRELEALRELDPAPALVRARRLAERGRAARFALEPPLIVLAGPVNAGKSTLFNLLYGRERVVVSATEGTTRDVVVERAQLGEWPVRIADTAGERELAGSGPIARIESEGQRLARELREEADLVLECRPAGVADDASREPLAPRTVRIETLADLAPASSPSAPRVSATAAPREAVATIERVVLATLGIPRRFWTPREPLAFDPPSRGAVADILTRLERGDREGAAASIERALAPSRGRGP
jgi:tRNA modification GTPase